MGSFFQREGLILCQASFPLLVVFLDQCFSCQCPIHSLSQCTYFCSIHFRLCTRTQRTGGPSRPKLLPSTVALASKLPAAALPSPSDRRTALLSSSRTSLWARCVLGCIQTLLHLKFSRRQLTLLSFVGTCLPGR